jgi:hypothetical protein
MTSTQDFAFTKWKRAYMATWIALECADSGSETEPTWGNHDAASDDTK